MTDFENYAAEYPDCFWIDFTVLENFMREALINAGVPDNDAGIIAEVLITADKKGIDSHGIGRFKPIYIDRLDLGIVEPVTDIKTVTESATTAVFDGSNGMGHVVAKEAMQKAIEKADEYGTAMTAVRNSSHFGIAGYYADMAADRDMIGIVGTNARPSIAPTFGVENMLGTNPLTIAFPTDEQFHFNLDCATSVTQRGKIEAYERSGKELPPGWVIDRQGHSMTDPKTVLRSLVEGSAALTPLGGPGEETAGYKGYGYAAAVEVLSAALTQANFLKDLSGKDRNGNNVPYRLGHFFIALSVKQFIQPSIFKTIAGTILRQLRHSAKAQGQTRIYTPGEKEWLAWQYRREHGCPVPLALRNQLSELNTRFGMKYRFPWENHSL